MEMMQSTTFMNFAKEELGICVSDLVTGIAAGFMAKIVLKKDFAYR